VFTIAVTALVLRWISGDADEEQSS